MSSMAAGISQASKNRGHPALATDSPERVKHIFRVIRIINASQPASADLIAARNHSRSGAKLRIQKRQNASADSASSIAPELTRRFLPSNPCPPADRPLERGCVRRTSRSRAKRCEVLNCSGATFPSHPLRLGLRPQSRSGGQGGS